jgi:hypothetical protein
MIARIATQNAIPARAKVLWGAIYASISNLDTVPLANKWSCTTGTVSRAAREIWTPLANAALISIFS